MSAPDLSEIATKGYLLFPGFFTADEVAAMRADYEAAPRPVQMHVVRFPSRRLVDALRGKLEELARRIGAVSDVRADTAVTRRITRRPRPGAASTSVATTWTTRAITGTRTNTIT